MRMLRNERGGAAYVIFLVTAIFLVVGAIPYVVFGKVVPPNAIGLRRNYFTIPPFLEKGYGKEGLRPGLHFEIPGLSTIFLLPRDFLFVNLNEGVHGGDLDKAELSIPTTDGPYVKTDIALILRLYEGPVVGSPFSSPERPIAAGVPLPVPYPEPHGGPLQLISAYALDRTQQLETFVRISENELKKSLSSLSTSDYYNPGLRERAAFTAEEAIRRLVAPNGIELWAALVRRYVYADPRIDDQIFEKNLEDQKRRLTAAASQLAAAKANTERVRALWDAKIRDLEVEGQARVRVLESEGELYETKKKAEGDLLVAKARAEVDAAKARVLHEVSGADVFVAREVAPFLRTLAGGVVTDIDPYDINRWMQKLLGGEVKQ